MTRVNCRFCQTALEHSFADLGMSPPSNSYLKEEQLQDMERFYPLHAYVCSECFLVQLDEFESPEQIFSDYAYFSSFSESWLEHAKNYVEKIISRFGLDASNLAVEIASNDGYLLQFFVQEDVPVLGIEPAKNVAEVAKAKNIPTLTRFFGVQTALELVKQGKKADLLLGNNVLAHVPDINDFVSGMKLLLKERGVITMEFPHLLQLIRHKQFDTIYHEHFSYLSLLAVEKIFNHHGLAIFDVEELPTHGGSLRIYAQHTDSGGQPQHQRVTELRLLEKDSKINEITTYFNFNRSIQQVKYELLAFLIKAKEQGKKIVAYGAAAKGNTLLNYCGIRGEFIDYVVDRSPHKQGLFLPGTHLPILTPEEIFRTKPDYILILPWNLSTEIRDQMSDISEWNGQFIIPIPEVRVLKA